MDRLCGEFAKLELLAKADDAMQVVQISLSQINRAFCSSEMENFGTMDSRSSIIRLLIINKWCRRGGGVDRAGFRVDGKAAVGAPCNEKTLTTASQSGTTQPSVWVTSAKL